MAQVVNAAANQVKLNNGQVVNAQTGGWYDGQQYWGGNLSNPGQINSQSNQQGAGQQVSNQVIAQTNPNNVQYIQQQQQQQQNQQPSQSANGSSIPIDTSGGGGGLSASTTGGLGVVTPPTINLQNIYDNLNQSAGIGDLEKQLADQQNSFNDAQSKINDNPFLSESNRVGRIQKLQNDFNNDSKSLTDQIAMKKADVQTQLDLATKQFDINSQAATQALNQFNTLLSSGALDNANGSDIANMTQATGLSSNMIQSAIAASKAKNQQTQVVSFDDGTNQGFAVIDPKTGNIISKQVIAASKPSSSGTGFTQQLDQIKLDQQQAPQVLLAGAKSGKTLDDMIAYGASQGVAAQDVYNIYKSVNYYHPTTVQAKADQKKYNVK